jgi:hypothetical protein
VTAAFLDDGHARRLSPLACLFCKGHDADRWDRYVGLPHNPDLSELPKKVLTIPELTDKMFEKTDMGALRNGDVNQRTAAAKLEETVLASLISQRQRFKDEGVKMSRICLACWEAGANRLDKV